jgi:predicted RNA-binding protein Jag
MATDPRPFGVIVNSYNPNASYAQNASLTANQPAAELRSLATIQAENESFKQLIAQMKLEKEKSGNTQHLEKQPSGMKGEYERRVEDNNVKIRELQGVVRAQEEVIASYKERIEEFEETVVNIMKLDKDIHTRLVNPQTSTTLESNVKNVLVALNGKAPYDRLIKMIESIKV